MGRELSGLVKPTAIQATCSALCDHFASATYFCRRDSGRANTTHKTTAAITDADHVGLSSTHSTISQILLVTIVPSTSLLCTNTRGLERSSIGGCYCAVPDRRTDGGRRRLRACRRMPRGQDCLVIGRALSFCASGNLDTCRRCESSRRPICRVRTLPRRQRQSTRAPAPPDAKRASDKVTGPRPSGQPIRTDGAKN